jgi:hypothetical protein
MALRSIRAAIAASLALVMLGASAPSSARAGQYHVYSCRTPAGESAPVDGWSGSKAGPYTYAVNTCAQPGGALLAALGNEPARTANTDIATWAFQAPAGSTIAAATLWRAGDTDGGAAINATYQFWLAGPTPTQIFDECLNALGCPGRGNLAQPLSAENRVTVPAPNMGSRLYVNASCGGVSEYKCPEAGADANGYAAAAYLYAADITLEQNGGPSASGVSGELASAPSVRGSSDVAFNATDPGAGLYEAVFNVDGRVVQSSVVDDNGGRCRDVGQSGDGRPAFLYVQPCLTSVSVDVPFDSTRVGNGAHHLIVSVIDAAGNAAPVLDREMTVANPPPPGVPGPANGANASSHATLAVRWKGSRRESLTSGYGRAQALAGRLTGPGGAPIAGAAIEVRATPAYAGAKPVAMASPRTGPDGRFSVRLARGESSRTLRFAYRAHLGDALAVATRTLTLRVRAGIALGVSPQTASAGSSIFFRGRLRGGPIPAGGKQLVLEARSAGSEWLEFRVIRTDARGRYRAAYRFKFAGPADYSFRVRSERESDYPFAAGSSNVVGVRER